MPATVRSITPRTRSTPHMNHIAVDPTCRPIVHPLPTPKLTCKHLATTGPANTHPPDRLLTRTTIIYLLLTPLLDLSPSAACRQYSPAGQPTLSRPSACHQPASHSARPPADHSRSSSLPTSGWRWNTCPPKRPRKPSSCATQALYCDPGGAIVGLILLTTSLTARNSRILCKASRGRRLGPGAVVGW